MDRTGGTRDRRARCPRADDDAVLYGAGDLLPADMERYERHLSECADCQAAVSEEQELVALFSTLPGHHASDRALDALDTAAREYAAVACREHEAVPWYDRLRGYLYPDAPIWKPALAWALALLFVAFGVGMLSVPSDDIAHERSVRETSGAVLAWDYEIPSEDADDSTDEWSEYSLSDGEYDWRWADARSIAIDAELDSLANDVYELALAITSEVSSGAEGATDATAW